MREPEALRRPGEIPSFLIKYFAIAVIPRTITTTNETGISLLGKVSKAFNDVVLNRNSYIWCIIFIMPINEFIY